MVKFFKDDKKISENAYKLIDEQLLKRLKARINEKKDDAKSDIDLKDDTDCAICFCEMEK